MSQSCIKLRAIGALLLVPRFSVFVWVSAGGRPCAAAVVVRCSGDLRPARAEAIVALSVHSTAQNQQQQHSGATTFAGLWKPDGGVSLPWVVICSGGFSATLYFLPKFG